MTAPALLLMGKPFRLLHSFFYITRIPPSKCGQTLETLILVGLKVILRHTSPVLSSTVATSRVWH